MSNQITLQLDLDEYPMLKNIKKKDLNKLLFGIFNTGYKLYFPNKNELIKKNEFDEIKSGADYLIDAGYSIGENQVVLNIFINPIWFFTGKNFLLCPVMNVL
mgnify:CR=1 FL=1